MKISSASKKVLASALSAAMVVAFAPAVALADTTALTDEAALAAGFTAKVVTVPSTASTAQDIKTTYIKDLKTALTSEISSGQYLSGTVTLLKDQSVDAGIVAADGLSSNTYAIDLNGHNVTSSAASGVALTLKGTATIKGEGTISNSDEDNTSAVVAGVTNVEGGTYAGAVSGAIKEIKGGTFKGAVTDTDAKLSLKGGTFEVSTDKDNVTATAIATSGDVTVAGTVSVKASAAGKDASAYGIDGSDVAVNVTDKGALTVEAATTGAQTAGHADAYGIDGSLTNTSKTGTATVSASAKDVDAAAWAVSGAMTGAANLTATVANDSEEDAAYVFGSTTSITGGKYVGQISVGEGSNITAGEFTANPKAGLKNTTSYGIIDDGKTYTVYTKGIDPAIEGSLVTSDWKTDNEQTIKDAVADAIEAIAYGESAPVTYADEYKAADVQAALKSGKVGAVATYASYVAKTATEAQAADYAAIEAVAKGKSSFVYSGAAQVLTIAITNGQSGAKQVVYGYVDSLGNGERGKARTITVESEGISYADNNGYAWAVASNGKASDIQAVANSKTKAYDYKTTATGVMAPYGLSAQAIKDTADKGGETAEKATQGIDVAKKSKTVKLAKKAKKTKKAASFNLGASAQTGLTIAKASGSSKVTVASNGKVTLKKGTKKGTYKAKVTINAAASDAYLAAAKTVTVTFKVTK